MKMKQILYVIIAVFLIGCVLQKTPSIKKTAIITVFLIGCVLQKTPSDCSISQVKRMNSTIGVSNVKGKKDTSYHHSVLTKGLMLNCLDSVTLTKVVRSYLDSCKSFQRVLSMTFYSNDEGYKYNWHETQDWDLYEEAFLVSISLNSNRKITEYNFRNSEGELIYFGPSFSEGYKKLSLD